MNNKRVLKLTEFIAQGSAITSCTIGHKSNKIAATGGEDKKVNIWTLNKPTCIMSLTGHTSAVNSISFSSNEDRIVSGSMTGAIKVWDLEVNKLICNLIGHKAGVTCLEYHTYADYIASGSVDSQIRLWDLRRKGCIFTYKGHSNSINSLRFSPDSKWIASVSDDCLVKLWDLKAGRLLIDLKGHTGPVNTLEFHPNEFLLATGSSDRTVKFWDLEKMENVSTSPTSPNAIKIIGFETNGKCLLSASNDYLQSVSWEPSEIYDSIYYQWKQISDMTISANKLLASSFHQNTVSFFAVDLTQVAPMGKPNSNAESSSNDAAPSHSNTSINQKTSMTMSTRRNFRHFEKIEASEQPDENQPSSGQNNDDNSQADIFNQEEYEKIFRPQKEISRPIQTPSNSASPAVIEAKKLASQKKKQEGNDFFIDIKTSQPPQPPSQQQQQPPSYSSATPIVNENIVSSSTSMQKLNAALSPRQENTSNSNNNNNNNNNKSSSAVPSAAAKLNLINNNEMKIDENVLFNKMDKFNLKDNQANENQETSKFDSNEFVTTIEIGHDALMKALRSRFKNIQSIFVMWNSGNIKTALDAAVNMNDNSLIADILKEMNSTSNIWNLDICTIMLPSIKNLINSKYEEHMIIGSESCKTIFKTFGKTIKSNILVPCGVGVDITREERQGKCRACYNYFVEIISIIEKKMPLVSSTRLLNNFREINLLMKTIE